MRRARVMGLVAALLLGAAPAAAAKQLPSPVQVSLDRGGVSTQLGDGFSFRSRITNSGDQPVSGLVAHLNVVGLSEGIYVDPEDWSEERTKNVPSLGPGEFTEIDWDVTAVTGGEAAIYVAVLPGSRPAQERFGLTVSPAMDVRIAETKDLNTDGVLPLTLAVPAVLAVGTLAVRRRRRG